MRKNRSPGFADIARCELLEARLVLAGVTDLDVHAGHEHSEFEFYLPPQVSLHGSGTLLTEPTAGDPFQIATDYLHDHAAELGLSTNDLGSFVVSSQYTDQPSGITHIYLRQTHGGLEVMNADLGIHVTARGEVINVSSNFISDPQVVSGLTSEILIDAPQAFAEFSSDMGLGLLTTPQIVSVDADSPDLATVLAASGVALEDVQANLVYVPTADGLQLAWRLNVQTLDQAHWYDAFVDADSGESLFVDDWVGHASYRVFASPLESPDDGARTLVTDTHDLTASPFGWHDTNGIAGAEFTDTQGNNAVAQEDADQNDLGGFRPDGGAGLNFDFPLDLAQAPATYQAASITNAFYWINTLHDIHYQYGFTEAAGNFQTNNYGRGGLENDAVIVDVQNGVGIGASFFTPKDGTQPRMTLSIGGTSNHDSALDNGIIIHEYGHGISERLTGGPANNSALGAVQSKGMGEGWGDWWAMMLTQVPSDTQFDGYAIGAYFVNNPAGARRFPYSFDMAINPLTYADFNNASTSSSEHRAGEIWASALWDMNWLLINKHGFSSDFHHGTGGNNLALQLVMDALKLQGTNPSLLEGRDAILAADVALTGGANQAEIWTAFARRGMGFSASDGGGSSSTSVTEAFDVPGTISGTVFRDDDADGVRDGGEPGLSGWTVYRDLNNNGVQDVASVTTFNSTDTPKAIPNPFTTSSIVTSGLCGVIVDVNITVNISHPVDSELNLALLPPSGTPVILAQFLGGSGANYTNTVFDDEAATYVTSASAPFTGSFKPYFNLSQLDGGSPNGNWRLRVDDVNSAANSGTILSWSIQITHGNPDPTTVSDANGNYTFFSTGNGTHRIREIVQPGFTQTAPAGGLNTVVISGGVPATGQNFGNRAAANVSNTSTLEDTLSSAIVLNSPAGFSTTHFKISGINGGTLFQNNGTTPINNGDFITVAQGQTGVKSLPTSNSNAAGSFIVELSKNGTSVAADASPATATVTVTPVGDTPQVANITSLEDTLSGAIVISRHAADGAEVTHFKISGITGGTLFMNNGVTQIANNSFITFAEAQAGVKFLPSPNSTTSGKFDVESSQNGTTVTAQSGKATSTITVTPVGDTPQVANITTLEDTLSGAIVMTRHAADGSEVTHFKISGITGGTLFKNDGVTPINNGDFLTVADGLTGVKFLPAFNSTADGHFDVESSQDGTTVAAQSGKATSTITVSVAPFFSVANVSATEGNGLTFTVTLSSAQSVDTSVTVTTSDGSATTADDDYSPISGQTVLFFAGETTKTVTVSTTDNSTVEADETLTITLGNLVANGSSVEISSTNGSATGTITNDDNAVFSVANVSVEEGNAATFTITLSKPADVATSVKFTTVDGSATTADNDYTAVSQTVTFAPGETSHTITVNTLEDLIVEPDESYTVSLGSLNANGRSVTISGTNGSATGTITNDDSTSLSISDASVTEGGNVVFTVTLGAISAQAVTVDFATSNGNAGAPSDYGEKTGTLTFAPGETTKTISVTTVSDTLDEVDETFVVNLSNATVATISDSQGVGAILDDDPPPSLSINDVTVTEGDSGSTTATFTVTLSTASSFTVPVDFATATGSALADSDFTIKAGTLTFAPGETAKTLAVTILGDVRDEPNETFVVNLSNASNATTADTQGIGTITDNDPAPSLSINDVSVTEGDAEQTSATFTVTLSAVSGQTVTVNFATANGSANSGSDFASQSGTLTFAPGETTKTVAVAVLGDLLDEADETFVVNLSNGTNATLLDAQGIGTITDNDPTPSLSIDDITVTEGNSGTTTATFTVSLSAASGRSVTVDFATASQSAIAPNDFTARTGSVTFAPGETTKPVTIQVAADSLDELDETFAVNLSNAINATIADAQGIATITDDDPLPSLSINDVTIIEGESGTSTLTFTVSLSAPSGNSVSVDFATADNIATSPSDYTTTSGSLTFAPGVTTKTIAVLVQGDPLDEANESLFVNLANATNATIADSQGIGTIADNDPTPSVTINDVTIAEGDFGTSTATFTVTLSTVSGRTVIVNYSTANNTVASDGDFTPVAGTLTFAAGETSKTIAVQVLGDLLDELNETFFINLSGITGAVLADNRGIGTILDDDPTPTLSINDVIVVEDHSSATFTVTLSAASSRAVTVNYFTVSGSAFKDFTENSGALMFAPGETKTTVTIAVQDDRLDEAEENFFVLLSTATNANIGDGNGTATIIDNDPAPMLSIRDVTVIEGSSGSTNATFTVTLSTASGQTVLVDYATADGTALAASDYVASLGTLSLVAGVTSESFTIPIIGDLIHEPAESFVVNLANPINVSLADDQAVATITDNDPVPSLRINDVSIAEGDSDASAVTFTVTLSAPSSEPVSIDYATANNTAVAPDDYTAITGTLSFAPGETSKTVTISVAGDLLDEVNERFFLNLSNATGATIADGQGVGTVLDNDTAPSLSIGDVTITDGSSGITTATFTANLSAASGQAVTVRYATSNGTASSSLDFIAATGTLTFPAGSTSQTISVAIKPDTLDEFDETFFVNFSTPTNASLADTQALGTITDDDEPPTLSINDVTMTEGNSGTTNATFAVRLSAASSKAISVSYVTANNTAAAGADYLAASGTATIPAGTTSKTFTVGIKGDLLDEANETFFVNLSNPTNASLGDDQAIGRILDNDVAPSLRINDVTITESNSGLVTATFTVTLSAISGQSVTVQFATVKSSAGRSDFVATSGTLNFAAGVTTKTITVSILGDLLDEADETFFINLSNATNASIFDGQGIGRILDDDGR